MRKKKLLQNTLFAALIACALYTMHAQAEADTAISSATLTSQGW